MKGSEIVSTKTALDARHESQTLAHSSLRCCAALIDYCTLIPRDQPPPARRQDRYTPLLDHQDSILLSFCAHVLYFLCSHSYLGTHVRESVGGLQLRGGGALGFRLLPGPHGLTGLGPGLVWGVRP